MTYRILDKYIDLLHPSLVRFSYDYVDGVGFYKRIIADKAALVARNDKPDIPYELRFIFYIEQNDKA